MKQFSTTGLCECNCGGKTAQKTHWRSHKPLPGKFSRFISGHNGRAQKKERPKQDSRKCGCGGWRDRNSPKCRECWNKEGKPPIDPQVYFLAGMYRRRIPLTQEKYAWVDAHRYDGLIRFNYNAHWSPLKRCFYAKRVVSIGGGKVEPVAMHVDVLGEIPQGYVGDHINSRDTLNNCSDNLRIATHAQNTLNRQRGINNTSGYKNIRTDHKTFSVRLMVDGVMHYFGNIKTVEEALMVRDRELKGLHGEFASTGEYGPTLDEILALMPR